MELALREGRETSFDDDDFGFGEVLKCGDVGDVDLLFEVFQGLVDERRHNTKPRLSSKAVSKLPAMRTD